MLWDRYPKPEAASGASRPRVFALERPNAKGLTMSDEEQRRKIELAGAVILKAIEALPSGQFAGIVRRSSVVRFAAAKAHKRRQCA